MAPPLSKFASEESLNLEDLIKMVKLATWDTCMDFVDDITEISRFASTCISPVGRVLEPAYKLALAPVKVVEQISKFWSVRFQQRFVQPLFDKLPVLFTLHLIGMLYSCFVFCYMPAAGILLTSPLSILFHTFFCLIISLCSGIHHRPRHSPNRSRMAHERAPTNRGRAKCEMVSQI